LIDEDMVVKISDFGLSNFSDATAAIGDGNGTGSTRWMSPELLRPDVTDFQPRTPSDIYSFGCLCIEVRGHKPQSIYTILIWLATNLPTTVD
jgi:serine/threonine protein kinase